jgi:hypothetical protein
MFINNASKQSAKLSSVWTLFKGSRVWNLDTDVFQANFFLTYLELFELRLMAIQDFLTDPQKIIYKCKMVNQKGIE